MNRAFCLAAAALFTLPVCAADEARDQGPFGGSVKFGFIGTSGSTQTSSLNTGFSVSYAKGRWEHDASIAALFASKNDAATAEAYETAWRGRLEFSERDFVFGRLNWRKDRFAAFDTQFSQTLGYGRRMLAGLDVQRNGTFCADDRDRSRWRQHVYRVQVCRFRKPHRSAEPRCFLYGSQQP